MNVSLLAFELLDSCVLLAICISVSIAVHVLPHLTFELIHMMSLHQWTG